jgi:alkanesulfonate monooxygenase SsuD/methylene tetrahydromethanopterin reductase-like flavin-dependent oxidoreductase (luciferase family)
MDRQVKRPPLFGVSITPLASDPQHLLKLARVADGAGLDLLGIQDHAYNSTFLDTWTLLSMIGGQTSNIKLVPDVATLPLRPPAMLAKSAASLDLLTGGRVEMGLGAGAFRGGIEAYGGPRLTPGEAVEALREGIEVMRLLWQAPLQHTLNYSGKHYSLRGTRGGPAPAHDIGIWLGVTGPRMLRMTGELADGWIVSAGYVPPAQAIESGKVIDEAARTAGRSPHAIRRIYNVAGVVLRPDQMNLRANKPEVTVGPVQEWADTLARYYHEIGMDSFIFWPAGGDEEQQFQLFAEEVVPAARAAIGNTPG